MKFEDITHEWVYNNKEILHQYFFEIVLPSYYNDINTSRNFSYNIANSYNIDNSMPYNISLSYSLIDSITINTSGIEMFILNNRASKNIYKLNSFLEYMREKKLNQLV